MLLRSDKHTRKARRVEAAVADCRAVVAAAQALAVKEFDFFRLAYRRWFGRQPDETVLEKAFAGYMLHQVVPPWVRHLSRAVLDRTRAGTLDLQAFGAHRYRDRPTRPRRGPLYVGLVAALWAVLFTLLLDTRYHPETSAPPNACVDRTGSPFFETWARLIAGKAPACERHSRADGALPNAPK